MAKNQCVNKKLAKRYAYYAQKRALQDDLTSRGEKGTITPTKHVGYYIITRK